MTEQSNMDRVLSLQGELDRLSANRTAINAQLARARLDYQSAIHAERLRESKSGGPELHIVPRGAGKSTRAIWWVAQDPRHRLVICFTRKVADEMLKQAQETFSHVDFEDRNFTTIEMMRQSRQWAGQDDYGRTEAYVDNAELVLANELYGAKLVAMSASGTVVTTQYERTEHEEATTS